MSPASALSSAHALQPAEGQHLGDAGLLDLAAVAAQRLQDGIGLDRAGVDAAGQDAAEERIGLERRHQHAERLVGLDVRRRHVAQDEVEQRLHVLVLGLERGRGPALAGGGEQGREIELLVVGLQRGEQVEHLVVHLVRPRIRAVDLVDQHDRAQAEAQRLAQHELGLRQRPFGGVDQQHHAVDHREDALDLAAEVGVARRVDDVDARALPDDRGRLGEDGDAALALQVVRSPWRARRPAGSRGRCRTASAGSPPASSCHGRRAR